MRIFSSLAGWMLFLDAERIAFSRALMILSRLMLRFWLKYSITVNNSLLIIIPPHIIIFKGLKKRADRPAWHQKTIFCPV
jgi:hypothetical protein